MAATFLRRDLGGEVEFIAVMLWDSMDAVRAIAGRETAVVSEERRKHLTRYDAKSARYEIASTDGLPV